MHSNWPAWITIAALVLSLLSLLTWIRDSQPLITAHHHTKLIRHWVKKRFVVPTCLNKYGCSVSSLLFLKFGHSFPSLPSLYQTLEHNCWPFKPWQQLVKVIHMVVLEEHLTRTYVYVYVANCMRLGLFCVYLSEPHSPALKACSPQDALTVCRCCLYSLW